MFCNRIKCSWRAERIKIGNREYYFRSSWEKIYAFYLEDLKKKKEIKNWYYEPEMFIFHKRKVFPRSYKPDFKIIPNSGNIYFDEVKGWMDERSKVALQNMKKYYPEVVINIIDQVKLKALGLL